MKFNTVKELESSFFNKETLVITSCTAKKLGDDSETVAKAKNMYQGRIVKRTKALADKCNLDWKILSAKYGLLDPEEEIHGYDRKLSSKSDAKELRPKVIPKLKDILPSYQKVLVLAGQHYREVLEPLVDDRFYKLVSEGYGDLCSKIRQVAEE